MTPTKASGEGISRSVTPAMSAAINGATPRIRG
jgi:hypothetical protein